MLGHGSHWSGSLEKGNLKNIGFQEFLANQKSSLQNVDPDYR